MKTTKKFHWSEDTLTHFILDEIVLNENENYYGTTEQITNSNEIYDYVLSKNIVSQKWFDVRLKNTTLEMLNDIYMRVEVNKYNYSN